MSVSFGKREVQKVAKVLDGEYESAEEAAEAVLAEAFAMYESRAKFTVVGQLYYAPGEGYIGADDERAAKVSLGAYSTRGQAEKAGESLAYNTQTHESFRWWALPIHHGTPASFYAERKKVREKAVQDEGRKDSQLEQTLRELSEQYLKIKEEQAC